MGLILTAIAMEMLLTGLREFLLLGHPDEVTRAA
jgi:small neutral amino acid transporter SnatA (MarC family)